MTSEDIINNCKIKMKKAFDVFKSDLSALRTGRANASMLDLVKVDVYGQQMPINQLASITTPEPRIPSLNEERRAELKKLMGGLAEKSKVSIRNIRREANDNLKKDLKDKKISEDEFKNSEKKIQNLTDAQISELENRLQEKEKEIMTV